MGLSPDDRFELRYTVRQKKSAYGEQVGCGEIIDRQTGCVVACMLRDNYTEPMFAWLRNPTGPVLIWASTYEYGYEIVDLGRHTLVHITESDGHDFIWTDCALSPDQTHLAVSGCHWACPYEIRILQIYGSPPILPLPEVARFHLPEGNLSWLDENTLCVTNDNEQQVRLSILPKVS